MMIEFFNKEKSLKEYHSCADLLKIVHIKILPYFENENCMHSLHLGFWTFRKGVVFLYY